MRGMRLHAALFAVFLATPALFAQGPAVRIHAATVLDGSGRTLRNQTIVVQGSKITSIETGNAANATYNLGQLTIMPGMIDVHAHVGWHFDQDGRYAARPGTPAQEILYSAENAYVTLLAGFTTIQSVGAANDVDLRDAIARGVIPGPRILTSIRSLNERSGDPEELRQKVRQLKTDGADLDQDLRVGQHPRRRQADDDRRAAAGGVRRGQSARDPHDGPRAQPGVDQGDGERRLRPGRARRAGRSGGADADGGEGRVLRPEHRRRAAELPDQQGEVPRHRQLQRGGLRRTWRRGWR